ncbi:uncharacterized protein LOC143373172 [Andrena cerasifolii]|uniref:uncharacterized protein LOC143373172 n=1 Tax=Andrena cerasifolii TaxID=2819439 RepID=UPI00403779F0
MHPEHKYPRLPRGKDIPASISHASLQNPVGTIDKDEKKFRKPSKAPNPSDFSTRCAYKALKYLKRSKELDFDRRYRFSESGDDPSDHGDESVGLCKSEDSGRRKQEDEESSQVELKRKSLKYSQFIDTDVERATLKLEETMSKTIPSGTRSTSGPSPQFIHPETRETPSASILSSIPKLSGYPRKNRDRCLPCMYKSFQTQSPRKISFPMTVLRRTINPEAARSASPSSASLESTSISIPSFEDEIQRILNSEAKNRSVMFDEEHADSQSGIVKETPSSFQEKVEGPVETVEQKGIPDSGSSENKVTTRNDEGDQGDSGLTSVTKDLNDNAKCTQVASLERSKVSFSVHSVSSVEDESFSVSIGDDQSKRKHVAPCHAPTIFRPSLEPLRALRLRKPTTLQDRIALTESTLITKSTSVDDYDDVPNKTNKSKIDTKKLALENTELGTPKKEQHGLGKGTDAVPDSSEIVTASLTNALQKLASVQDNVFSRATDPSKPVSTVPLRRTGEIVDTLANVKENASSTCMLESLCKEFSERLSKNATNKTTNAKRTDETMTTLTRLLVDSKRYLYPDKFPSDLLFSTTQPPPCNPRILRHILPSKSYTLIAPLLGLPEWQPKKETSFADIFGRRRRIDEKAALEETLSTFDRRLTSLEVHPPTPRDTESIGDEEEVGQRRYNPYALFLIRPRRKVITWRPLKENDMEGYDPDATLRMRADNVMKKICQDFCQWLETLGGTDTTVDEEVLRDMFEIDFNVEACRAMQVSIQEMPVVPAEVALTRNNPGASMLAMTRNHLMRDAKAEETSAKTKAFGTTMPWELQFVPPKNQVRKLWLECENVPRDLETMDVVWKGITHLKSVRGFVEWLQQHPEVPPPEALKTLVSMDLKTLRQTEDDEAFAHLELDINQITSLKVADSVQVVS